MPLNTYEEVLAVVQTANKLDLGGDKFKETLESQSHAER
jgi:hypothetical protein